MSHPSLDSFGDLDEAARDPHVSGCERCREELRAQQQVRDLLAALPDPGPVPPDVVDRIEATLRRLSVEGAVETATAPGTAGSTVVPLRPEPVTRRRRPLLAVAAAVVLLSLNDAVLAAFVDCAKASREEDGCLDYWVTPDPENAGRLNVFERWTSEKHLAAHFRTAHIGTFRAAIEAYPRNARSLHRYFVARGEEFSSSQVSTSVS